MNKSEKIIRREIFKNNRAIRGYLISDREKQYLDFIALLGGCFTQELSDAYSLEIQNAHNILRRLFDKKWLSREHISEETGGIRYFYRAITYQPRNR